MNNLSPLQYDEFRQIQNTKLFKILQCAAFWLLVIVWPAMGVYGLYVFLELRQRLGWCFLLICIPLSLWLIQIGVSALLNNRHMDIFIYPRIRALLLDWRMSRNSGRQLPVEWREIIENNLGWASRIPKELKGQWEQRILTFMQSVKFVDEGVGRITDVMRVCVAAEACVLIINRPIFDYRHLYEIHLWPNHIRGQDIGGAANFHEVDLRWDNLAETMSSSNDGYNITLHEFAHVIDNADDGEAQSIPLTKSSPGYDQWVRMLDEECAKLKRAYRSVPEKSDGDCPKCGEGNIRMWEGQQRCWKCGYIVEGKVDPEVKEKASKVKDPEAGHVIREYGTLIKEDGSRPEFFTCATEVFFERPAALLQDCPRVYEAMKDFYRVDPAEWS
tara:strand:+ start:333 stop:1493 length:1161 start_codon:yes stop_codon:yes gene_type:complete